MASLARLAALRLCHRSPTKVQDSKFDEKISNIVYRWVVAVSKTQNGTNSIVLALRLLAPAKHKPNRGAAALVSRPTCSCPGENG